MNELVAPLLSATVVGLMTWGGMRAEIRHLQEALKLLRADFDARMTRSEADIKTLLARD